MRNEQTKELTGQDTSAARPDVSEEARKRPGVRSAGRFGSRSVDRDLVGEVLDLEIDAPVVRRLVADPSP